MKSLALTVVAAPGRAKLQIQRLIVPAEFFVVENRDHMVQTGRRLRSVKHEDQLAARHLENFIRCPQQRLQRPNYLPFTVHPHHQAIMPAEKVEIMNTQAADNLLRTAL